MEFVFIDGKLINLDNVRYIEPISKTMTQVVMIGEDYKCRLAVNESFESIREKISGGVQHGS